MKREDLEALRAAARAGQPAVVRHPDFPNERFEVISVTDTPNPAQMQIASQYRTITTYVDLVEPWFRPPPRPPYETLLDAARITVATAAETAPDYHVTRLHRMVEELEGMHGAVVANRQRDEEAATR